MLGDDVHDINVLTVIASESYDSFAKGLQDELAETVANRPKVVDMDLFIGKTIVDEQGNEQVIDASLARKIFHSLVKQDYIDDDGVLTNQYYEDKKNHALQFTEAVEGCVASVADILDSVYSDVLMKPENARSNNVELKLDKDKLAMPQFKELWNRISQKSAYVVDFDTDELVEKSIASLNKNLRVASVFFTIETGSMEKIDTKEALASGSAFVKEEAGHYHAKNRSAVKSGVKYDLVGKLVEETGLTRKAVVDILVGIDKDVFDQFKNNPEEFIIKAANLINDEKATVIIQHITYNVLDEQYDTDLFTDVTMKGKLGVNAMRAKHHLYDHIVYDSTNERDFATELDTQKDVAVYVKLPNSFYISTPVGKYNPDWAIAFYEGAVKHIYFVAETKGSMSSVQLREVEKAKIHCAKEHFKAISGDNVVYDVVDSYSALYNKVMK